MSKIFKNLFTGPNDPNSNNNSKSSNNSRSSNNTNSESLSSKKLTFITNAQTLKDEDVNKLEKTFESYKKRLESEKRKNKDLKNGVDVSVNVLIDMNKYLEKQKLFQDKIIALSKKYDVDGKDDFFKTNIEETNKKLESLKETIMLISKKYEKSLNTETKDSINNFLTPSISTGGKNSKGGKGNKGKKGKK